jgi:type IV secretion system protein VirB3
MENGEQEIHTDVLFVGLTRPATVFGISYYAFVAEIVLTAIIFLAVANPFYLLLAVPIHAVLYLISLKDPAVFSSVWLWINTNGKCRNFKFWGGSSFSPVRVKKWTD